MLNYPGSLGLLLALPYGVLANTKGRKLVAALSLTGQIIEDLWTLTICMTRY